MIDFVLEYSCEESTDLYSEGVAVYIERLDAHGFMSGDDTVNIRYAQTSFWFFRNLAFVFDDFGVDEGFEIFVGFIIWTISDHDDALHFTDLDSGQSDSDLAVALGFPVEGSSLHLFNNRLDLIGYDGNSARCFA